MQPFHPQNDPSHPNYDPAKPYIQEVASKPNTTVSPNRSNGNSNNNRFVSNFPLVTDIGASIMSAVLMYAIANTKFISEYTEVTEGLIKKLSKTNPLSNGQTTREEKIIAYKEAAKNQGAGTLTLDTIHQAFRDNGNSDAGNYNKLSNERLQQLYDRSNEKGSSIKETEKIRIKETYEKRLVDGSQLKEGVAGKTAQDSVEKHQDFLQSLKSSLDRNLNNNNFEDERVKATELRKEINREKKSRK